ncbi:MAG: hypothetical protein QM405_05545 [Euryarchaeota archaeon]|jgi:uncharacterized Fe-S cluster-containing radical SAM superfamily enzyme|nr:hypothetical protein [Euryarchaeota archaeon]
MARVAECLEKYGFEVLEKYEFNYQPTKELDQCYEIGTAVFIKLMGEEWKR